MKTIPLTQGCVALVDDEDYEWLNQWKWCLQGGLRPGYAVRLCNHRGKIYMHREILKPPDGFETDHINGNGLDNQRSNLRLCTRQQNNMNRGVAKNRGTSRFKGVYFASREQMWCAHISRSNRKKHLGYFNTEEEAALAYNHAAQKYYGEFAWLNQLEEV